jgi:serine/threonine-protein kinase
MQKLGSYSLLKAVGVGSTGTVWQAVQSDIERIVAIKVLAPGVVQERLQAEARILASLDHPNIVKVFDFAEEWIDGERLDVFVSRLGSNRLSGEQAVGVVRGALQGLAHAHSSGVVHGDMSAGNILIDQHGTSRLIDFGLASASGEAAVSGTPAFISPEAALGRELTPASDVYSAAAVLYYLLDGRPPFGTVDAATAIRRHLSEAPPMLAGHGDDLSELLARAMAKEPALRPQNAAEFLAELEDAASKRYGPGWLARASIAGLVAAPAATTGVMAMASGTGTGTGAVGTQPDALIVTAEDDQLPVRRRPVRTRTKIAAGAGAVIVVGAVATAVVAGTTTDKTSAGPVGSTSASSSRSAAPKATPPAVVTASGKLVGKYRVVRTLTGLTYRGRIGELNPVTWTISRGCAESPCLIEIASSTGQVYRASFDGVTLTISFAPGTDSSPCFDATGAVMPSTRVNETDSGFTGKITILEHNGVATAFSGSGVFQVNQSVSRTCIAHSGTIRENFSATRL